MNLRKKTVGRPRGTTDQYWPDRLILLLGAIVSIQEERHTVSLRELETSCGVSRQTIAKWLLIAEERGYLDRHDGQPRALQLLPAGRKLVKRFDSINGVRRLKQLRQELNQELNKYAHQ